MSPTFNEMLSQITEGQTGFRLHKLEVLNWGTFDGKIYSITPNGQNALLTGDIGSGKSTLVDAITTLLVPHNKIIYNKAAGAENRTERNLNTYIRGEHTNRKDEATGSSKPVYLRDDDKYTVILGNFYNEGYSQHTTLAQVFWLKNNKPEKFFVLAADVLTIREHFSDFGDDISELKKHLKEQNTVEVFETFTGYSDRFRQVFGIKQTEALDLFYQTVSMKSVGNLTDFVRNQMLGKTEVKEKIEGLIKSFDNLTETHNSVLKAKHQLEILNPVINDVLQYDEYKAKIKKDEDILKDLPKYFAIRKVELLKKELLNEKENYFAQLNKRSSLKSDIEKLRASLDEIRNNISGSEIGKQLENMEAAIKQLDIDIEVQKEQYDLYEGLCKFLQLKEEITETTFYNNRKKFETLEKHIEHELYRLTIERDNIKLDESSKRTEINNIQLELNSLRQRKSQIPNHSLEIRTMLATELDIDESEIPFAGELIQVKEDEKDWEGAIERRLQDLGLSLLVPEQHYKRIMDYVDKTNLRGKLVYLRTLEHDMRKSVDIKYNSLVNKIEIKADSDYYDWLERELELKHNLICCEDTDEYQREFYAITKKGQIKTGRVRHEKDDRKDINDKRHFILGWSNTRKIDVLEKDLRHCEEYLRKFSIEIEIVEREQKNQAIKKNALRDLNAYTDFQKINFKKSVIERTALLEEYNNLKNSEGTEQYNKLKEQILSVENDIKAKENNYDLLLMEAGKTERRISDYSIDLFNNFKISSSLDQLELDNYFNFNDEVFFNNIEKHIKSWMEIPVDPNLITKEQTAAITLLTEAYNFTNSTINGIQKRISEELTVNAEKVRRESQGLTNNIIRGMQKFKSDFPSESSDFEVHIDYVDEIKKLHKKVSEDDLPKHEERFKSLLRENTINELLLFNNNLYRFEKEIKRKIEEINNHLMEIDYNTGTYIKIMEDKVHTEDIILFKNDLKKATEGVVGDEDLYSEEKFEEVKKLLDRFKSVTEEDKRWTDKVTDVRQWFTFGASERNKETDEEREYYSDSSGKSGGQKEKLAYTILASAIAYQFGLGWGESRSRSFRFVVIDEAFGRGSDDSTRYGLRLFEKLNLQLLIVTPLQKINIIEDYIHAVHFVSNPTGNKSMVRNLTKTSYIKEKAEFFNTQASA